MNKRIFFLLLGIIFFVFGYGKVFADYAYIEDPDGKIYTVEITKLSEGKFSVTMEDVSSFFITFKAGMSHNITSTTYNFNYGDTSTDPVSIQFMYKSKRMGSKFEYDFSEGKFIHNYAKLGDTANGNYIPGEKDNNLEENIVEEKKEEDDDNTIKNDLPNNNYSEGENESTTIESSNEEKSTKENSYNVESNNNQYNNAENNNTEDNNTENNTTKKTKNNTINLSTNREYPEINQYINLTIRTDSYYVGNLLFYAKYRDSSSSDWNTITSQISSTYFSNYSSDWGNGYYEMKSYDNGKITLNNLVRFKKSGNYRIYVKDTDNNEDYIEFKVTDSTENNMVDDKKVEKYEGCSASDNKRYQNAVDYNDGIISLTDSCYISIDGIRDEYDHGTISGLRNAINTAINNCNKTKNDLEDDMGWSGDVSLRDAVIPVIKKTIEYFEKLSELIPIFEKGKGAITDEDQNLYNSIMSELNSMSDNMSELETILKSSQENFAKKWGFELTKGCSTEGSKYSYEQNIAYQRACINGITTIQDINSAGLDQPLTRSQLAKMMSMFEYSILGKIPQAKDKVKYKDVSSSLGDLESYIQIAYEYGIMGVDANGSAIPNFNPYGVLNRGDFATVFSRVLRGTKYNRNGEYYYSDHISALKNAGYLSNTDSQLTEIRGYVMIMMYRAANNLVGLESNNDQNTSISTSQNILLDNNKNTNNYSSNSNNRNNNSKAWEIQSEIQSHNNNRTDYETCCYNKANSRGGTEFVCYEHKIGTTDPKGYCGYNNLSPAIKNANDSRNNVVIDNTMNNYNTNGGYQTSSKNKFSYQEDDINDSLNNIINTMNMNTNSYTSTTNFSNNDDYLYDRAIESLGGSTIRSKFGLKPDTTTSRNRFSSRESNIYDVLYDSIGTINANTNSYTSRSNFSYNQDYLYNRFIEANGGSTIRSKFGLKN